MIEFPSANTESIRTRPLWRRYTAAVIFVVVGIIIRLGLDDVLGEHLAFVTVFPAVAAAVWFAGPGPAILAILLGGLAAQYLFGTPRYYPGLADQGAAVGLFTFFLASAIIVALGTSLHEARARSERSRSRIQTIVDALPALVSLIDREYRYRLVNAEYSKWFGLSGKEIIGKTTTEVLGAEVAAKVKPRFDQALAGEEVTFREHLPYSHGGGRWVQVTYRPYQGDAGEILGVVVLVNDVTEQHEAALELRRREAEFRAIFELNATGCAQVDMATERFTRVNQKFCELTGYTREELLQKSFTDVTHPEDRGAERILVENAYRNGAENWEFEKRYVRKDGGIRWVLVRGTFLRDASGEAKQTVATITDLTEWKEHQRALTESETRYRQALEAGQFGAWEWLLPENRVHWSERLYAIHGVSPSEFKNTTEFFKAMVHPDDWDRVYHVIQMIQEGRPTHGVEYRMIRPDGEQRWLWTTATAFFEGKQPIKMVGITTDITERKKIELQLRESEERLRLAQRAAKVGTWDLHLDTQQFVWSEGMFDLLGIPAWHTQPNVEQALKLVHPEDQAKVEALLPELVARGGAFNTEFRVIRPNGDVRWLLSMGKIESGENQRPVRMLGVTVDITERKKAEELLQSQAQELEALVRARTERLQEVIMDLESFSYTVAHDLRGPLRAMNGFATALEEDYGSKLDEQGHEYTRRITRSAERMDRLICDVLDYSKITRATFEAEPVPLEPLLQGIIESYPALQNPETAITLEKPLPVVLGTSSLVVQCFSNLIGNAVKFVPAGTPPRVRVWADQVNNGTVKIWVEDNGVGVAPENYERIFGLFQRLDKNYEGTGIGLAIVARAVERMGGKVGIEPAPERGTRFWVELKAAPDKG